MGVKVLVAVGDKVEQTDFELGSLPHAGDGRAQNLKVGHRAGAGDHATTGGRSLLVDLVVGPGSDPQHTSFDSGVVVNRSVDFALVQRGDRGHADRH